MSLLGTLRRWRRKLGRGDVARRLLKLAPGATAPAAPGLVIVQIDGLGRDQFDAALAAGRLPFLRRLLRREHYVLHDLYAGVPCTTPAVQTELFYGQKATVPAFSFRHPDSGEIVRMLDPGPVRELEERLGTTHVPLLAGGASYGNIFTGGATEDEAHFCVAALGWGPVLRSAKPLALAMLVLTNLGSVLRVAGLVALEFAIAISDFVRGLGPRFHLLHELKFVPTRVAVSIGLRELIAIGAAIDIARGLPIIHLNLVGYDEQAHRRGPRARFAHWALKGIDRTIARLWRQAMASEHRDYRVWIYSDHGQERATPYALRHGRDIEEVVAALVAGTLETLPRHAPAEAAPSYRARTLRRRLPYDTRDPADCAAARPERVRVAALGPMGFVYLPEAPTPDGKAALAAKLVAEAGVPAVLCTLDHDRIHAWTRAGVLVLPEDGAKLLGESHPFLIEAIEDVMSLVRHPCAGDLVLSGWCAGDAPHTFAMENGAHGGYGPHETHGIALLDADAKLPPRPAAYVRARDLRRAALAQLGRDDTSPALPAEARARRTLRAVTYNVHGCRGLDGRTLPHRIARVLAQCRPDVVALQELDVGRARSQGVDQAHEIAAQLAMSHVFHPAYELREEQYGNAVLSTLPIRLVKAERLPGLPGREPRGALWVAIDAGGGRELQVVNTHLGLSAAERRAQIEVLAGAEWLLTALALGPAIVCGDFNAGERSYVWRRLSMLLRDVQRARADWTPRSTWFAGQPTRRIDHVFASHELDVLGVDVPRTQLCRRASDHLPLVVELALPVAPAAAGEAAHDGRLAALTDGR